MIAALLIHDDLADRDRTRYGRATVWEVFGVSGAIHLGTTLLTLAFRLLDREPPATGLQLRHCMNSCVTTICRGQVAEAEPERNRSADLPDVMTVYAAKTAPATGYFFSAGCIAVQAPDDRIRAASQLGESFGLGTVAV